MKRILVINTIGLNFEGITTVIYNYINAMNKDDIEFNFISYETINTELKIKFEKLGNLLYIPNRKQNIKEYIVALNNILKDKYDVVHIHGNSGTMIIEAFLAKMNHVNKIITHCHSTRTNHPVFNFITKKIMISFSDVLLACSDTAGRWLYGNKNFVVLKNAINLSSFKYSLEKRSFLRKELNINSEIVVGHVGHFSEPKNHPFLIEVFKKYKELNPNSKLILISDGPNFEQIKQMVYSFNLQDSVIFLGRRSDVNDLYNAMDIFVIPSLWEGLSLVTVEAQVNGLPVLASENIPKEAKCTDNIVFKSLEDSPLSWAEELLKLKRLSNVPYDTVVNCGFSITTEANKLREIYFK